MKIEKIIEKIKKVQSEKRFNHTLGVSYTAASLAMKYDENIESARLAGILHDCAKHVDSAKSIDLCDKYNIKISIIERENPYLLHGKVGALIAKKKFGIVDEDILNSITYHTTGRANMSLLEKIIYVADYIEPNRPDIPNLALIRKLAFEDIDMAIIKILENTFNHLKDNNKVIDPLSKETYDFYMKEMLTNAKV